MLILRIEMMSGASQNLCKALAGGLEFCKDFCCK